MNKQQDKESKSRRQFLKQSLLGGAGLTAVGLGSSQLAQAADKKNNSTSKITDYYPFRVREHDSLDDIIDIRPDYQRMNQKNLVFSRGGWDPKYTFGEGEGKLVSFMASRNMVAEPLQEGNEKGYGAVESALSNAAVFSNMVGTGTSAVGLHSDGPFCDWDVFCHPKVKHKHQFASPEEAAKYVKKSAKFLGASAVGIAPYDERWVYSHWYNLPVALGLEDEHHKKSDAPELIKAEMPFQPKSVIVTLHQMDLEAMKAPGLVMNAATMDGYSKMAEVGSKVASFINALGYKAAPVGNGVSMSVPTALQAGLGESSRMGLLIHPELGPGVRIQKVYTDLEIRPDKPITFGVKEFCRKCMKCADECPSNAISRELDPTPVPNNPSISSHPGVTKWYQDNEKCFDQWEKMGLGCGICYAVCPYNKPENWVHDFAKLAVGVPVGRDIARILDDGFGYGEIKPENVDKFWDKEV